MNLSVKRIQSIFAKCHKLAEDSPDPNTQVGSKLIHKKTRSSVAEGFNGFARGVCDRHMPTGKEDPERYRHIIHAEVNVVSNAFVTGAVKYDPSEYSLFVTHSPCENCARFLKNVFITEVYCETLHRSFDTYREGTQNPNPAQDIVGVVNAAVPFPGGYNYVKPEEVRPEEKILWYRIHIKAKEY